MKRVLLLFLLLIAGIKLQAQTAKDTKVYFSKALAMHLPKYDQKAKTAYRARNYEEATALFESFITNKLEGTYIDNFRFQNLKNKEISLYSFKKPVFLLTYASWCVSGKGEISALNALANKYKNKIDFVALFWNKLQEAKQGSKKFNAHITVLYIDETQNTHSFVVRQLKHALGLSNYLISGDRRIVEISRSIAHPYSLSKEDSFQMNYEAMELAISKNLIKNASEVILDKKAEWRTSPN